jgi:hypothetical protein
VAYKILSKCPVCSSRLKATRLKCDGCSTVVENQFELSKFDYLNSEQLSFIEVFLKSRGNIKDVEKELGISYPTVRAKLDEVIVALGYTVAKQKPSTDKKEVIDMLEKGEITADEALKMLSGK